jgi:hypothetical protein
MSKRFAALLSSISYLASAAYVFAQVSTPAPLIQAPGGSVSTNVKAESIPQLIINLLFGTAIFLAIAYLMYGGIKWMTSRGDKVGVETARKHIVAAIIGLIIVAGSFFILQVVFTILGADNPLKQGFTLPKLQESTPAPVGP